MVINLNASTRHLGILKHRQCESWPKKTPAVIIFLNIATHHFGVLKHQPIFFALRSPSCALRAVLSELRSLRCALRYSTPRCAFSAALLALRC